MHNTKTKNFFIVFIICNLLAVFFIICLPKIAYSALQPPPDGIKPDISKNVGKSVDQRPDAENFSVESFVKNIFSQNKSNFVDNDHALNNKNILHIVFISLLVLFIIIILIGMFIFFYIKNKYKL
jgi:hypothetical protein